MHVPCIYTFLLLYQVSLTVITCRHDYTVRLISLRSSSLILKKAMEVAQQFQWKENMHRFLGNMASNSDLVFFFFLRRALKVILRFLNIKATLVPNDERNI